MLKDLGEYMDAFAERNKKWYFSPEKAGYYPYLMSSSHVSGPLRSL